MRSPATVNVTNPRKNSIGERCATSDIYSHIVHGSHESAAVPRRRWLAGWYGKSMSVAIPPASATSITLVLSL